MCQLAALASEKLARAGMEIGVIELRELQTPPETHSGLESKWIESWSTFYFLDKK